MGYRPAKQPQTIASLIVLFWLLLALVPWNPLMPQTGLDPSWMHGINQALAQGLVFGKDIVFTLGPMASVFTQMYHPEVFSVTLAGSLLLALAIWGLLQQIWGRQPIWIGILGLTLGLIGQFDDAVLLFYPVLVALRGYQLARSGQHGWPGWILATAPLGLLALVKGTYLGLGLAVLLVWSLVFLLQNRPWLACLGLVAPVAILITAWVLVDQPPIYLVDYLQQMLVMSSSYTEAMAKPGPVWEVLVYIAGSGLGLLLWIRQGYSFSDKTAHLALWLSLALFFFMAFRAGFARHDAHATIAAQALLLGGVVLFGLIAGRFRYVLLPLVLLGAYSIENNHLEPGWGQVLSVKNLKKRLDDLQQTLVRISGKGTPLPQQHAQTMQEIAWSAPLPRLDGSSDIYAYQQVHLLASGNTWNPRPTLQSHMAYSPTLTQLNRQHLLDAQRPDHLVVRVETIDRRLPSLDDGASWPAILTNYRPVQFAGSWLILRRPSETPVLPRSVPISSEIYQLGQKVSLPRQQGLVMAKIDIRPKWLGNLANLVYRTAILTITLELDDGEVQQYRLIRGMAQAGFVLSPMVENTSDFALLFDGDYREVRQFTITTSPLGGYLWQPTYNLTLEYLSWQPPGLPTVLQPLKITTPAALSLEPLQSCLGHLDQVNDKQPQLHLPNAGHRLKLSGWLALSTDPPLLPQNLIGVLISQDGRVSRFDLQKADRPDVASHFGQPSLRAAGFWAEVSTYHLPDGTYTLAVGVPTTHTIGVCHPMSTVLQIRKVR